MDQGPKPKRRAQRVDDEPLLSFAYSLTGTRARITGLIGTAQACIAHCDHWYI